jgi:ATP-dependent Clp protease ATP-binding subunit ClpC
MERLRTLEIAERAEAEAKETAVREERLGDAAKSQERENALSRERKKLKASIARGAASSAARVRAEDVAHVVARMTNVPVETVLATERERMSGLETRLREHVLGQEQAVKAVADAVRKARLGLSDHRRPKVSMLFAGPSGIGKTELARTLAKELFGREDAMLKLDMSEFAEGYSASKLLGSPAGYVGYRESNRFTDVIRKRPHSVVCFDEVEKAHPEVLNLLLQLLEDGKVTDATGRGVSFRQAYVILTSNIGSDAVDKKALGFEEDAQQSSLFERMVRTELEERFRPELLNRLDRVIVFRPLGDEHIRTIVKRELDAALERVMAAQEVACTAGDDVLAWLLSQPMPPKEGARAARRLVEREITDLIGHLLSLQPTKKKITLKATKNGLRAV